MRPWLFPASVGAVLAMLVVAVGVGPGQVPIVDALRIVGANVTGAGDATAVNDSIVWALRLPRALLAVVIGLSLGAAGTITQGLFRNPMAEPGVLGVSMGAATAAVLGFVLGLDAAGPWVTPLLAAVGAAGILVVLFVLVGPASSLGTLLLSGIALGALCSAVTALLLAINTQRWDLGARIVHWLMGSFEGRSWQHLSWSLPGLAIGGTAALWLRKDLDLLHLGTDTAASLGVDVGRAKLISIAAVAVLVGGATALTGVIGFVGLIVPHVARMLVGPAHARLMPVSMTLGAVTLLAVDTLGRVTTTIALPPGVITSLLGAPFFLWLVRRHAPGGLA